MENMCVCLLLSTFDKAVRVGTGEEPGTLTQGGALLSRWPARTLSRSVCLRLCVCSPGSLALSKPAHWRFPGPSPPSRASFSFSSRRMSPNAAARCLCRAFLKINTHCVLQRPGSG